MKKIDDIRNTFFYETFQDTWRVYEQSINNSNFENWDYIVLTASNKEQANVYRQEIKSRLNDNKLPKNIKYMVIEDLKGKRIGSGGATLNVLKSIVEESGENNFNSKKILLIHSGGDSKRIPQYSCSGKLFAPVQRELPDGRSSTLFDELIIAFSAVPSRMSPGLIVLSGDVLLVFNPTQIDLHYTDCAGISIKTPVETGKNHGVFLTDKDNVAKKFLHKQTCETLRKQGAVDERGNVDIDTGAIFFSYKVVNDLYSLISKRGVFNQELFDFFVNDDARISFYGDFLYPLAKEATLEQYYKEQAENVINDNLLQCRKIIWNKLKDYNLKIIKLSPADFIHYGTTKELLELLTQHLNKYKCMEWKSNVLCNLNKKTKYVVNSSYIHADAQISDEAYIENSYVGRNAKVGKKVILSNVKISNTIIPDNVCLNTIVTKDDKFITRIYAINDNPKTVKSEQTKFLNTVIENMMLKYDIDEKDLWDDNDRSIWKAKLYTIENSNEESIKSAIDLYHIIYCNVKKEKAKEYFKKERYSLYKSFNMSNTKFQMIKNETMNNLIRQEQFINLIKNNVDLDKANEILLKGSDIKAQLEDLIKTLEKYDYKIRSRVYLAISKILSKYPISGWSSKEFEEKCYNEIKRTIVRKVFPKIEKGKIKNKVVVELPIRVNFAGGWSDTPPYCLENGGTVLNGAFKLNGKNPIKVTVLKNDQEVIRLKSIDAKVENIVKNIEELKVCDDSHDLFSLSKASLLITGIVRRNDRSLKDVLDRVGTGFDIITDVSAIPRGSGLGTSSILSAACIKALYKFLNIKITEEELCQLTLEQEQLMGTGGGWQDQIGGVIPGIKCTTTQSGLNQTFEIDRIKLSATTKKQINERMALIYTGQRRLAKNLLREVMNGYISNNENSLNILREIRINAVEMSDNLKNNDIETFADNLTKYWKTIQKLDSGCTNTCINQILASCDDLIIGRMMCGAGGGGFLQVILKKGVSKEKLKKRIDEVFQECGIKVYDITLFEGE